MPADLNDYFNKKKPGNDNRGSGQNNDKESPFKKDFKMPNIPSGFGKFGALAYIIIAIIAILAITQPFKVIHSGEVGIKATAGKYEPNPLQPGFHFFLPFIQDIIVVDTRVRIINYTSGEDMGESLQKSYQGAGI
ncbi:MAG: SPFH domain-containing protein, partial [Campylobacter concisus]|nr:SPFH domain-containing protein [Campylobacter concisus]